VRNSIIIIIITTTTTTEYHRINQALAGAARLSAKVCEFLGLLE